MQVVRTQSSMAVIAAFLPTNKEAPLPQVDGLRYAPTSTGLRYVLELLNCLLSFNVGFNGLFESESLDKQDSLRKDMLTLHEQLLKFQNGGDPPIDFFLNDGNQYELSYDHREGRDNIQLKLKNTGETLEFKKTYAELMVAINNHVLENAVNYVNSIGTSPGSKENVRNLVSKAILNSSGDARPQNTIEALEASEAGNPVIHQFMDALIRNKADRFAPIERIRKETFEIVEKIGCTMPDDGTIAEAATVRHLKTEIELALSTLSLNERAFNFAKKLIAGPFNREQVLSLVASIEFEEVTLLALANQIIKKIESTLTESGEFDAAKNPKLKEQIQSVLSKSRPQLTDRGLNTVLDKINTHFAATNIADVAEDIELFLFVIQVPHERT
jgi:ElaB/YqjD/DUF883 family membrane-anchored ribosome-binding protein